MLGNIFEVTDDFFCYNDYKKEKIGKTRRSFSDNKYTNLATQIQ